MDDQQRDPNAAPPATAESGGYLNPWQIPGTPPTDPGVAAGSEPSAPALPGTPGEAPVPLYPVYPGANPAYPAYPTYPTYPSNAPYQGAPSTPLPGSYPSTGPGSMPSMPLYPGGPPAQYYPVGAPATIPFGNLGESRPVPAFARPLPLWLVIVLPVAALVVVLGTFIADTLAAHADWADSASLAGIIALALCLGALIVLGVRIALGRREGASIVLGLALVAALAVTGIGGVTFSSPIHRFQGRSLEGQGLWAAAADEFGRSGERAPNAPDIARTYDEWGESLLAHNSYAAALDRFNTVITVYDESGAAVDRGYDGIFHTYAGWVRNSPSDAPYANAIEFFGAYAGRSSCDSTCQSNAHGVEAQARYQYGQQLFAGGSFEDAITQFEAVQSQFSTSPYASQAHTAAAKAYLALGQQQLTSGDCVNTAVSTYKTLATKYIDTPEGKQAKAALAAPVSVTGHISGPYPRNPAPLGMLSKHVDPPNFVFSAEYTTGINAKSGAFTFRNIKQGKYNFSTVVQDGSFIDYVTWFGVGHNYYFVQVGPLCTVHLDNLADYPTF